MALLGTRAFRKLRPRLLPEANLLIDPLCELAEAGHDIALARVFPIPQQDGAHELQLELVACKLSGRELSWQGTFETVPDSIEHLRAAQAILLQARRHPTHPTPDVG